MAHHARFHSNQFNGESVDHEFHFDFDRAAYDSSDARGWELVYEFRVEEAREVAVHPFVATDQLVAEAEPRHQTSLF
jgi:hypothetical protein